MSALYYSASSYYKRIFGTKVYKLSIDAGCTCPNRDGTKSFGGCIFCSNSGSGDFAANKNLSIKEQIEWAKTLVSSKLKANQNPKYIAYFQNFSNTYGDVSVLEQKYNEALNSKDVVGLSIATRPDCLSDEILEVIKKLSHNHYISIELGFQTFRDDVGQYIRRFYTTDEYYEAVQKIHNINENIHVVTHVIFGLPSETEADMMKTIDFCVNAKTDGIKITVLYVLENTDLENEYKLNKFKTLEMQEYFNFVAKALCRIPQNVVIHRLTGDGAKKDLIAPLWTSNKKNVINSMNSFFLKNNVFQGRDF